MQIIKFYSKWSEKCKLFSDKEKLGYTTEVDIDLPSYSKTLIKYQISIVPTFVALSERGRILGKLSNPINVKEYINWKNRLKVK